MIKDSKKLELELSSFLSSGKKLWKYGNDVLYRMCAEEPFHQDADVVVGKIWLIGRSYAAAIERRKNKTELSDNFYYSEVAPKMLSIGNELDKRLSDINKVRHLSEETIDIVLNTHKFLMDAFYDLTQLEKRSLASKYLHFHCPSMFWIYDSRANNAIRKHVALDKKRAYKHYSCGCDREYADFSIRMIELQEFCFRTIGTIPSPREIDDFLLYAK